MREGARGYRSAASSRGHPPSDFITDSKVARPSGANVISRCGRLRARDGSAARAGRPAASLAALRQTRASPPGKRAATSVGNRRSSRANRASRSNVGTPARRDWGGRSSSAAATRSGCAANSSSRKTCPSVSRITSESFSSTGRSSSDRSARRSTGSYDPATPGSDSIEERSGPPAAERRRATAAVFRQAARLPCCRVRRAASTAADRAAFATSAQHRVDAARWARTARATGAGGRGDAPSRCHPSTSAASEWMLSLRMWHPGAFRSRHPSGPPLPRYHQASGTEGTAGQVSVPRDQDEIWIVNAQGRCEVYGVVSAQRMTRRQVTGCPRQVGVHADQLHRRAGRIQVPDAHARFARIKPLAPRRGGECRPRLGVDEPASQAWRRSAPHLIGEL